MAKGLGILWFDESPYRLGLGLYGQRPEDYCSAGVDIGSGFALCPKVWGVLFGGGRYRLGLGVMVKGQGMIVQRGPISGRIRTPWPEAGR